MSQKVERADAIAKIRKIQKRTLSSGCTEAEAIQAMDKVAELMELYNIELSEVVLNEQECVEVRINTGTAKSPFTSTIVSVAELCGCLVYSSKEKPADKPWRKRLDQVYVLFGLQQDVELGEYLYDVISKGLESSIADFKKSEEYNDPDNHKLSLLADFRKAYAHRMCARLDELKDRNDEAYEKAQAETEEQVLEDRPDVGPGTDILVIKTKKIRDEYKAKFGRAHKYGTNRVRYGYTAGFRAGSSAADQVGLNRPVDSDDEILAITYQE